MKGGQMENIMPEIKAVDPRAYLADRIKRGADFIASINALGKSVDLSSSNHISNETPRPING